MSFKSLIAATVLLGAAAPVLAHPGHNEYTGYYNGHHNGYTHRIDQRQERQEHRIEQGIRRGQLTPHEARQLQRGQAHIAHLERQARADGVITRRERARIAMAQDRQDQLIRAQRRDEQHAHHHGRRAAYPY